MTPDHNTLKREIAAEMTRGGILTPQEARSMQEGKRRESMRKLWEGSIRSHQKKLGLPRQSGRLVRHELPVPGCSLVGEPAVVQDILVRIYRKRRLNGLANSAFRILTLGLFPHLSFFPFLTDDDFEALHRRLLQFAIDELATWDADVEPPPDNDPVVVPDVNDVTRQG